MLDQMLAKTVREHPEKTAIVYDKLRISYEDLYAKVKGFSQGLSSIGIRQGDCVALVLPNCPEFAIAFYAIARLNAIALPLNHLYKTEELHYYISDSNAKAIITDAKRAELCQHIISKLDNPVELIVVDEAPSSSHYFPNLILPPTKGDRNTSFAGDVLYQYSSGSTGRPKRVSRTQQNLYCEANNFQATANLTASDTILCLVPLYHAHGLGNCLLAATVSGATLVILEQTLQNGAPVEVPFIFRCPRVLALIEAEKVTILPAVPYILNALAQTPTSADLSTLRLCFSAGNFLPKEIFDKFRQRFDIPIRQLYGCTEAGSVSINLDAEPEKSQDSVGLPMQNVEIKLIDEEGNTVPVGEIGEVLIKSDALTRGYHNLPELNQQAFKGGWYFTGDLGKQDADGRLYITGRKKILIDTGGRKVDPIEIEDILLAHPKIQEVVVVGVKGVHAGELVKAAIVLKEAQTCEKQEIFAYCKERMAEFKIPKIIEFREEIPKSPLGKVLRKALV